MYQVRVSIEGIAPLLFNAPPPGCGHLVPGSASRFKTEEDREAEAWTHLYRNGDGVYLPSWNLKKCILQGFQTLDLRMPGSKSKRMWRYVQPVLFLEPGQILFGKDNADFLHRCPGRLRDGSATIVRRPAMETGWRLSWTCNVLDDVVPEGDLQLAIKTAGERVGLGGWRPEYGRFILIDWQRA